MFFDPPDDPLSPKRFAQQVSKHGVRLDGRTLLLRSGRQFWINGEPVELPAGSTDTLRELASARSVARIADHEGTLDLLYDWYCDGFLHTGAAID